MWGIVVKKTFLVSPKDTFIIKNIAEYEMSISLNSVQHHFHLPNFYLSVASGPGDDHFFHSATQKVSQSESRCVTGVKIVSWQVRLAAVVLCCKGGREISQVTLETVFMYICVGDKFRSNCFFFLHVDCLTYIKSLDSLACLQPFWCGHNNKFLILFNWIIQLLLFHFSFLFTKLRMTKCPVHGWGRDVYKIAG